MSIEIRGPRAIGLDFDLVHERMRLAMVDRILELQPGSEIDLGYFELFTLKTRQKRGKPS